MEPNLKTSLTSAPIKRVVLYDGICNLCDFAVRFILPRDPEARFQFASLQGEFARSRGLGPTGPGADSKLPPTADSLESIILLRDGQVYRYSSAVLRILGELPFPWNLLTLFRLVPAPIRDGVYRWVARNRYRWFGQRETCILPTAEWKSRFLD